MLKRLELLRRDCRGAYDLIQFAVILPVFVVVLYGSFEIYKLASIRQSLDSGTYQAARYLSVYHLYYVDSRYDRYNADDTARAEWLIAESMRANSFVSDPAAMHISVRYFNAAGQQISTPVDFPCRAIRDALSQPDSLLFTVQAQVSFPWQTSVLGLSMGTITLTSRHTSFVDCGPWYPPPHPTATPTPTATPAAGG